MSVPDELVRLVAALIDWADQAKLADTYAVVGETARGAWIVTVGPADEPEPEPCRLAS